MTGKKDKDAPITWGDLEGAPVQSFIQRCIRSTMRTCVAFFTPFVLIGCGLFTWYADRLVDGVERLADSVEANGKEISGIKSEVSANAKWIEYLKEHFD